MRGVRHVRFLGLLIGACLLAACSHQMQPVAFHATGNPDNLKDWHVVQLQDGHLMLNKGVVPYSVNTKLFSDYAYKLRTVWMPKGEAAKYEPNEAFDFPVGTIISKTFYYPLPDGTTHATAGKNVARSYAVRDDFKDGKGLDLTHVHMIETRLLVLRKDGWVGLPYVWNAAQTEARLQRAGAAEDLVLVDAKGAKQPFTYVVPDSSQCAVCHNYTVGPTDDASPLTIRPIGPAARHLNRNFDYATGSENQLVYWTTVGYLTGAPAPDKAPRTAQWTDTSQPLTARARAYLDANCAYCHNPHGEANYTALWLESKQAFGVHTGLCKTPVAAGRATGNDLFDIVPGQPDASIIAHRMASTEVGVMMPELGRTTADAKGVKLIRAWISSLQGQCKILHNESAAP